MAGFNDVAVTVDNLREVVQAIRKADAEIAKGLRRTFRQEIGNPILAQVRAEAPGKLPMRRLRGSGRLAQVPPTVYKLSVDNDRVGISITKARSGQPGQIARIFEIGSARNRYGIIRHPLFGNRNYWYQMRFRPVLRPILERNRDFAQTRLVDAVNDAARRANIKVKAKG